MQPGLAMGSKYYKTERKGKSGSKKCYQKNSKQLKEEITSLPGYNKTLFHLLMHDDNLKDTLCLWSQCVTNSSTSVSEKSGFSWGKCSYQWMVWGSVWIWAEQRVDNTE